MRLDTTYLRSRLGRRIFWLFIICALGPISALALVSLMSVSGELRQQSLRRLDQASHDEGMVILERLILVDTTLRTLQSNTAKVPVSLNAETHFGSLVVVSPDGTTRSLMGPPVVRFELSDAERLFVDSGKTLLTLRNCAASEPCVYLVRNLEGLSHSRLIAHVQPGFLWSAEELPGSLALSIFGQNDELLYDSRGLRLARPNLNSSRSSGELQWLEAGQTRTGQYWRIPMKSRFLQDHWTIVVSEEQQAAFASLGNFRRNFPLVILLALWIVLFLSLILIRRTLVPLEKLREGTGRISRGEFEARVQVESQDEFQDLATSFNLMAARIETQFRSLKTLNEMDRAILSSWDIDHIVTALVARLPDLLAYEVVGITIVDFHDRKSATTYIAGSRRQLRTLRSQVSAEDLHALCVRPESFVLERGGLFPQFLLPLVAQGMRRFLLVPVFRGAKPAAVLAFGRSSEAEWPSDDRQQAHRLADQVAVALSNAELVAQLEEMRWGTLTAFARAIDAKSHWTAGHSERVTAMGIKIGKELGLSSAEIDILHAGGLLHDVGKIGVPVELLDKPGALTPEERLQIQEHVLIGVRILKPIRSFEDCLPIVQEHHERFDGKGYPYGLAGENITLHGRIFAVADVHDALISERPYRKGMPHERVMTIIREGAGKDFDPRVVEAFFRVVARGVDESAETQTPQPVVAGEPQ